MHSNDFFLSLFLILKKICCFFFTQNCFLEFHAIRMLKKNLKICERNEWKNATNKSKNNQKVKSLKRLFKWGCITILYKGIRMDIVRQIPYLRKRWNVLLSDLVRNRVYREPTYLYLYTNTSTRWAFNILLLFYCTTQHRNVLVYTNDLN